MDSFICGFAYGLTSVIAGQPLDTYDSKLLLNPPFIFIFRIKTQMQAAGHKSSFETANNIFVSDGLKGFYRGGLSMILGGAL